MSAIEKSLPERVTRLETTTEAVLKGIGDLKQEMRERLDALQQEIRGVRLEMNGWLKWMLGFIFSSWLTIMVSIWLKR